MRAEVAGGKVRLGAHLVWGVHSSLSRQRCTERCLAGVTVPCPAPSKCSPVKEAVDRDAGGQRGPEGEVGSPIVPREIGEGKFQRGALLSFSLLPGAGTIY